MNQILDITLRDTIDAAFERGYRMKEAAEEAVSAMAQAGRLLNQKKASLNHGEWSDWLKDNLPTRYKEGEHEVWQRTANNWMKIAKILDTYPAAILDRAHNIRQLFQLAGAIPEGESGCNPPRQISLAPQDLIGGYDRWWTTKGVNLTVDLVAAWPMEQREALREKLKPAAELYAAI
jgi:hypothetical protein